MVNVARTSPALNAAQKLNPIRSANASGMKKGKPRGTRINVSRKVETNS